MQINKLALRKTKNMRDIGGIPTADGRVIKSGKLIRSGRLHKLPCETVDALIGMGVVNIIDLRTDREIIEHIPTLIDGAEYYNLPLVCTATPGITTGLSMAGTMMSESKRIKREFGTAENYMTEMYNIIMFEEQSRKKLKKILDILTESEGCTIWHCNSGKDRAGLVAMLVEGLLGVNRENIIEDYMGSGPILHRRRSWQKAGLRILPVRRSFKQILYAMMDTKREYIEDTLNEIDKRYGSIEEYARQAMDVSDSQIAALKYKYLE